MSKSLLYIACNVIILFKLNGIKEKYNLSPHRNQCLAPAAASSVSTQTSSQHHIVAFSVSGQCI